MMSFGLLRRVALVRTDVSEESIASIIRATKIGGSRHPNDGGDEFLRNVGSCKSHTA
jgi:hypothetical protein